MIDLNTILTPGTSISVTPGTHSPLPVQAAGTLVVTKISIADGIKQTITYTDSSVYYRDIFPARGVVGEWVCDSFGLIADWKDLNLVPTDFSSRWPTFAEVTQKPSTVAGFGITDAFKKSGGEINGLVSVIDGQNIELKQSITGAYNSIKFLGADSSLKAKITFNGTAIDISSPVSLKTINGQGSSIAWASIDVTGTKGGYAGFNFTDTGHWFGVRPDGLSGIWNSSGTSKWYFNESGWLGGGAVVPWNIIADHPSRTNWASKASVAQMVTGQLVWNNYGNGHTIFDASAGTSPDGTTIDKNNSQIAWRSNDANYPTLMGWNGVNTYGVRVDSARVADASITADRLTGVVGTNGQDLTIHGKRAMVGSGDSNTLILNYGSDWGSTIIYGNVFSGQLQSDRLVVLNAGSANYGDAGLEVRVSDGATQTPRISMHRPGICAAAFRLDYDNTVVLETANPGALGSLVANNMYSNAGNTGVANQLTRTDYVNSIVNGRNVHSWKGQKGDANASFGLGSYIWHPTVANPPISNTYAHGFQFGGTDYASGQWVSDIAFIHGNGLYHRANINGSFANWSKFAFAQEINYTATPTQYRSISSWIGLVSGVNGADAVVIGTNSGAATIGAHSNGLDAWAPLYINCHPNSSTTAPLVLSAPKVKLPDNNTLYDVWHSGNFDPNSKVSIDGSYSGTIHLGNWFRSYGTTGWYNETFEGGIYMDESTTIKIHNGKKFYTANAEYNAIAATGGIFSYRGMSVDTRTLVGNGSSYNYFRYNDAPFHAGFGGLNTGSFAPIVGSANYVNNYGYTTRVQFGVVTPGGGGWSNAVIMVGSAESDAHPLAAYNFGADGHMTGLSAISLSGNANIGNDMICNYAYANGSQPMVANALTRYDHVNSVASNYRWNTLPVIQHGNGDANAHYNSAWDGASVANAPSADWHFFRELYHSGGANWRHQEAFNFFTNEEYFRRGINASEYDVWCRRWHSGNFNPDTKANLSGATFTGNITAPTVNGLALNSSSVASTIAVRDSAGDLQCRLVRSEFGNQSDVYGAIAFRGSSASGDNYVRFCSEPSSVRNWIGAPSTALATTSTHGLMSALDKFKLDLIPRSKSAQETILWSGEASASTTTLTVSQSLYNFNAIRFQGTSADRTICWTITMPAHEWATQCASGKALSISSGSYYFSFIAPSSRDVTTFTRNINNAYLTKIIGLI